MKWLGLKFGGQKWGFYIVSPNSRLLHLHGKALDSCVYFDKCRAYFSKDLSDESFEDAFIHELQHIIVGASGGGNVLLDSCTSRTVAAKAEEQIILCTTPMWHSVLKDLGLRIPKRT